MALRVGYVREHFSSPLLQFAEQDGGKTFTLVECPSGTGQLIGRLTNDEIDVAIALTDPLISGIAKGSEHYKLVGSFVSTPLNWAVITGKDTRFKAIADLKETTLGISRHGSGSQTMAYVMALQQGWPTDALQFKDRLGPHALAVLAHRSTPDARRRVRPARFLDALSAYVRAFDAEAQRAHADVAFIREKFGYPEADIRASRSAGSSACAIPRKVIVDTLNVLEKAGFITSPEDGFDVNYFVNTDIVKLI
ncbi:periplasmic binding protein-like II [Amylocystis lapponica]|nr:periplasmic binding protein-like II [Amylocystis lapponica]